VGSPQQQPLPQPLQLLQHATKRLRQLRGDAAPTAHAANEARHAHVHHRLLPQWRALVYQSTTEAPQEGLPLEHMPVLRSAVYPQSAWFEFALPDWVVTVRAHARQWVRLEMRLPLGDAGWCTVQRTEFRFPAVRLHPRAVSEVSEVVSGGRK
jgi:hypothetical protein